MGGASSQRLLRAGRCLMPWLVGDAVDTLTAIIPRLETTNEQYRNNSDYWTIAIMLVSQTQNVS